MEKLKESNYRLSSQESEKRVNWNRRSIIYNIFTSFEMDMSAQGGQVDDILLIRSKTDFYSGADDLLEFRAVYVGLLN